MKTFEVPTREQVSETNQHIFDNLKKGIGMVPNLYATFAHSDNALSSYVTLQSMKSSLSNKEKEVVNLVVSQINDCIYCLSAHTAIGKMNGFSDDGSYFLFTRWLLEGLFLAFVLQFFRKSTAIYFIPWVQLVYPFYVLFFGIIAQKKSSYIWKDRSMT